MNASTICIVSSLRMSSFDSRLIERWLPGDERPSIHAERLEWQPAGASSTFVIELEPFFTEVLGPA